MDTYRIYIIFMYTFIYVIFRLCDVVRHQNVLIFGTISSLFFSLYFVYQKFVYKINTKFVHKTCCLYITTVSFEYKFYHPFAPKKSVRIKGRVRSVGTHTLTTPKGVVIQNEKAFYAFHVCIT